MKTRRSLIFIASDYSYFCILGYSYFWNEFLFCKTVYCRTIIKIIIHFGDIFFIYRKALIENCFKVYCFICCYPKGFWYILMTRHNYWKAVNLLHTKPYKIKQTKVQSRHFKVLRLEWMTFLYMEKDKEKKNFSYYICDICANLI